MSRRSPRHGGCTSCCAPEAVEAYECVSDPAVRAVLARVAANETRHAELAWRTLRWLLDAVSRNERSSILRELHNSVDESWPIAEARESRNPSVRNGQL